VRGMIFPSFKKVVNGTGESLLPHRPPFLFVDRLISCDDTGALGEYTFTEEKNDFFKGHFPNFKVVPGVVLIEAMAQVAGASVVARGVLGTQVAFVLATVDNVRFRQPFRPGDRLVTVVEVVRERVPLGIYRCKGYLNGEPDAKGQPGVECDVRCMMGEKVVRNDDQNS